MTEVFELHYYKINKCLLNMIGQWPYQDRTRRKIFLAITTILATSGIPPQVSGLVKFGNSLEVIIQSGPPLMISIYSVLKLIHMIFYSDKMLQLIERIKIDWISLTGQPEIHILHHYAEGSRRFTIAYAVGVYVIGSLFVLKPVILDILQTLKLTNKAQSKQLPFQSDFFGLDMERYYFYIIVHAWMCCIASLTIILAADTMFFVYVQHACGMFTLVGRQMESMNAALPENCDIYLGLSQDPAYELLTTCNKKHNKAIEFADLLETLYTWLFFSHVGVTVLLLSATGYQTVLMLNERLGEATFPAMFVMIGVAQIFCHCYLSQKLLDHSEQVRDYIYQAEWYKSSVCAQNLIKMIIIRTYIPCQLTAGKFFIMSLNNFTSIVKMSVSYFTLLRSTQ